MVEMLPLIHIAPEMNLALDPGTGAVGASLGKGIVILSMDDINEEISKIELAAEELMESLNPNNSPLGAYPGREGAYVTAGMLTNIVYGFVLASIILIATMPLLTKLGVL